jgi:hypothetical protein
MSDELFPEIRIDPNEELTAEKQLILLNQWKQKVEQELVDYGVARATIAQEFKVQKDRFDKILSVKVKKMKKYDTVMNSRKRVLVDIVSEIGKITPPTV